jgi:hypothetical protein
MSGLRVVVIVAVVGTLLVASSARPTDALPRDALGHLLAEFGVGRVARRVNRQHPRRQLLPPTSRA